MLPYATHIINQVAEKTERAILFHSATGKDSIALLDLMYPHFREVVCVYMYIVRDLEHINKYILWAKNKYPAIKFLQIPHYALSQYIRDGFMGCRRDKTQRVYQLNHITAMVKKNTGIEWAFFGFKQSDNMNRRLQLKGYKDEGIYENTKNAYPLSRYKNADMERYIKIKKLIPPVKYGYGASQGTAINSLPFLLYCKDFYPNDYQKVIKEFPQCERIMFEYEKYKEEVEA